MGSTDWIQGLSWSWSYGSWIYNYLCNQCLSPLMLWVLILFRRGVLDITLCDKVSQWLAAGFLYVLWFPPPIKLTRHDRTEILLKVALNTITPLHSPFDWILLVFFYILTLYLHCNLTSCINQHKSWDKIKFFNGTSRCHPPKILQSINTC
jgi:hypothetical protein